MLQEVHAGKLWDHNPGEVKRGDSGIAMKLKAIALTEWKTAVPVAESP